MAVVGSHASLHSFAWNSLGSRRAYVNLAHAAIQTVSVLLFSRDSYTGRKMVSQCDNTTLRSTTETLIIYFNQEKFEQLFFKGGTSLLNVCKHRNISLAKSPLATSWKLVSVETKKAFCEPISVSSDAKQTRSESTAVSTETKMVLYEHILASCEARKALCEPKRAFAKASWTTKKSNLASCEVRDESLLPASREATSVSGYETISTLHRAKPRFSRESKAKSPLSASATLVLSEANSASLKSKVPLSSAKVASNSEAKALSAKTTSPSEVKSHGEAILSSPMT